MGGERPGGTSRRVFLKRGGATAAGLALVGVLPHESPVPTAADALPEEIELIRPEDQVVLTVAWLAAQFDLVPENGGLTLVARPVNPKPVVTVELAPQQVLEWSENPAAGPSRPVHPDRTRLLFSVPAGTRIPLTTAGWLAALRDLPLLTHTLSGTVGPVDIPTPSGPPLLAADLLRSRAALGLDRQRRGAALVGPAAAVTVEAAASCTIPSMASTELAVSSRLVIAPPGGHTRFTHAVEPARQGTPFPEIWQTRLTVLATDGGRVETSLPGRVVRVLTGASSGTDAYSVDTGPNLNALLVDHAQEILCRNGVVVPADPEENALNLAHLHLSPRLGATARLSGRWDGSASVQTFKHRLRAGRDVLSRIAVAGRLYPLGHKAVLTVTAQREFDPSGLNGRWAMLRRRSVITVDQNLRKNYPARTWPFSSVEVLVDETPSGTLTAVPGMPTGDSAVWIAFGGEPYEYPCRGIDRGGNVVEFRMPLVFVPNGYDSMSTLVARYAATATATGDTPRLAVVDLGHVTVAEPGGVAGATEVIGEATIATTAGSPYSPFVTGYAGRVPALGHLANQTPTMSITYATPFAANGFGTDNPGEVVLALGAPVPVALTGKTSTGGLVGPLSMTITGLSRRVGAVAGPLDEVAGGFFKPSSYLAGVLGSLKLFGVFPLGDLIAASADLTQAPTVTAATVDGLREQTFRWVLPLLIPAEGFGVGGAVLRPSGGTPTLTVESVVSVGADGQPHQRTTGIVTAVQVALGLGGQELVRLPFGLISFESVDARKPNVDVDLGQIEFLGILGFVRRLADVIGGTGFGGARSTAGAVAAFGGGGPSLEVTPEGVRSSFALALPNIAVGMFSLENILFTAALDLRFTAAPRLTFGFGSIDNPFGVFVSALGGGGFLQLTMSVDHGLEVIEGALEFGAQLKIDLGVVAGKVSAMGGIYFKLDNGDPTLTGYFRIHGEVSVLSIVTCGVEQEMSLTYSGGKVRGEAELAFYVKTFFFSKTVRKKFSRTFAGSNGDPTFAQLMAPASGTGARPWDSYCKAFG